MRIGLVIVIVLLVAFGTLVLAYRGFILDDTTYAPGYSEDCFSRLRPGMSSSQVRALLGSPLRVGFSGNRDAVGGYPEAVETWQYSARGRFGWRHKDVAFDKNGTVVFVESRWEE